MNIVGLFFFFIFIYYLFNSGIRAPGPYKPKKEEFRYKGLVPEYQFPTITTGEQAFKYLCENNQTFKLINSTLCS